MKTRAVLSVATVCLGAAVSSILNFFYSPISGVATANALRDDSVVGYGLAKFLQQGGAGQAVFFVVGLILVAIWFKPIYNAVNSK